MLLLLTAAVFILVAAGALYAFFRFWAERARVLDRLDSMPRRVTVPFPSPGVIWHELVARVGRLAPETPKNSAALRRRLIRAGIRSATAPRTFLGTRAALTVLAAAMASLVTSQAPTQRENMPVIVIGAACAGYMLPGQYLSFRLRTRKNSIQKGLPNALDLMVVCVEAGLGLDQTILQVAKELEGPHPEITEEFTVMNTELRAGKTRQEALHNLAERTGVADVRKLVAVLIQTDRFGTSIGPALREHADYMRVVSKQRAEEKAAKIAVKLVFPIFFCILPSLFVVTTGPVVTQLVRNLLPMLKGS